MSKNRLLPLFLSLLALAGVLVSFLPKSHGAPKQKVAGLIFPEHFIWGVATSTPQTEGLGPNSDWAVWLKGCRISPNFPGLTEEDIALAANLGIKELRFSVEWSRVEPEEGKWNEAEIEHFVNIAWLCKKHGIRPFVNLHHFTLPLWVAAKGGFTWSEFPDYFARYADKIACAMRDAKGARFMTFNEPLVPVEMGYMNGAWPPWKRTDIAAAEEASWQIIRAHKAAYRVIHERLDRHYYRPQVGVAYFDHLYLPEKQWDARDRNAAAFLAWRDAAIMDAIVDQCDYIGINYYQPSVVKYEQVMPDDGTIPVAVAGVALDAPSTEQRMSVYPEGIGKIVRRYARYHKPIIVTENGVGDKADKIRARFIVDHLAELYRAVCAQRNTDAPIIGYFYWSLADTFEWDTLRMSAFGLIDVDAVTHKRSVRPSALLYRDIIRDNGVSWRALEAHKQRDPNFK